MSVLALVIVLIGMIRLSVHGSDNVISGDFAANYTGASIVRDGNEDRLYDVAVQQPLERSFFERPPDGWFNLYILPPFVAYAFLPFAYLPYGVAAEIYFALSVVLIIANGSLLWSLLDYLKAQMRLSTVLLCAFVSAPAWYLFMIGQNTAILMFLLVSGLTLLVRQRDLSAGLVLGIGIFKPQIFILIPVVLLLHRRWRALAGMAATSSALVVVSFLLVGVSGMRSYLHLFSTDDYVADIASGRSWRMISLVSQVRYLGSGIVDVPVFAAWVLSMLPLALTPLVLWKVRGSVTQMFALAILLTMIFNPHIYYYDLLLVLIPALILLDARPGSYVVRGALVAAFVLSWMMDPLHGIFGDQGWPLILLSTHWLPVPMLVLMVTLIRELRGKEAMASARSTPQPATSEVGSLATTQ